MSNRLDVMISSTARDLLAHRQAALDACMGLGLHPVMMEHLPALDADAIDASLKMVDDATIYLGIFAHRYGYIPNDPIKNPHGLSITELEYHRAVAKGKPRLLFVVADSHTPALPHEEAAPDQLRDFKDRITTERVVKFFHSADDLRGHITQALAHWLELRLTWQPAPTPDPATLSERGILPPGDNLKIKGWTPNANFVGRAADLQAIAQCLLHTSNGNAMAVTAAMGAGGIGKTQLAIEFAYRYGRYFHGVHWLSAQFDRLDPEIAACGYPNAMNLPNFPDKQDAQIERVLAEWAKSSPRLLIVDNAEKPEILKEWLPRLQGHRILITSRRGQFPAHWGVVAHRLDVLTPAESTALLRRLAPHLDSADPTELEAIGEKLGYLPLALDLAGNYINFRRMTPTDYLSLLDKQTSLVDNRLFTTWASEAGILSPTDHDLNLYANFDLSWQRLTSDAPKRLLMGCAYLAPNTPIPLDLLTALFETKPAKFQLKRLFGRREKIPQIDPAEQVDLSLNELDIVGLLNRKEDGLPSIHPLIADFARLRAENDSGLLEVLVPKAVIIATEANETGIPADFAPLRQHVERLAEHAEFAGNEGAGVLWNNLGYHLHYMLADFTEARIALERALRIDEQVYGLNHSTIGVRVNNLGDLLREMGDYEGAIAYLERALRIDEKAYGTLHPSYARDANNLGSTLQDMGDYEGAKAYLELALKIDEAVYHDEHPNIARDANNLGGVLNAMGDQQGAKELYERALRIWKMTLPPDHPKVAFTLNNLAIILMDRGDLTKAKEHLDDALYIWETAFGPVNPNVATCLHNLGVLAEGMGDLVKARAYLERALAVFTQLYPVGHLNVLTAQRKLEDVNRKLAGGD